jgi:hypothetical protein
MTTMKTKVHKGIYRERLQANEDHTLKICSHSLMWWYKPIIPSTQEVELGGSQFQVKKLAWGHI